MKKTGKILVVDDTLASLKLITEILTSEGYSVYSADSGYLALTSVKKYPPDLILLDILMPGTDGFEVIRQLKNDPESKNIPVIFVTAVNDVSQWVEGLKLGAVDFVSKPYQREELLFRVQTHLELKLTQEKLKKQEIHYQELFNHIPSGIAVCEAVDGGRDFIFKDFNIAGQNIDSISREELLGHKVSEVFPGIIKMGLLETIQRVWESGTAEQHPVSRCDDDRLVSWRSNFVYKLPSGEIVVIYEDLTKPKQTEIRLTESEERFRTLADTATDGIIIINSDGMITFWNNAAERIFGYSSPEIQGKSLAQIMPSEFRKDHADAIKQRTQTGKNRIIGKIVEVVGIHKTGSEVPLELSLSNWEANDEEFYTAIIREISKRKELEEKIRLNSQMLSNINDGILLCKVLDGKIFYNNRQMEEIFGYLPGELVGKPTSILNSSSDTNPEEIAQEINDFVKKTGKWEGEIHNITKDGRDFWSQARISSFIHKEYGEVFVTIQQDITESKNTQLSLERASTHDFLTGLYNRAFFDEELKRLQLGRRFPVSVIMADIDGLKNMNDKYGHDKGDQLLQRTAKILAKAFRGDDMVARLGGDEFIALLPNTDAGAVKQTLLRIEKNFDKSNTDKTEIPLSISLGASTAENGKELKYSLLQADKNMYIEKSKEKNN